MATQTSSIDSIIREMVAIAVDAKIGEVTARADAMVRLHGEFVKRKTAASLLNVSSSTIRKLCDEGYLDFHEIAGISVRSIAALTERGIKESRRKRKYGTGSPYERKRP